MVERNVIQREKENLSIEEVYNRIKIAYKNFIKKDQYLLEVDANERSITHRLAIYLEALFPEYDVDCEYNRNGIDPKILNDFKKKIDSDDTCGTTVYPDIIIHLEEKKKI